MPTRQAMVKGGAGAQAVGCHHEQRQRDHTAVISTFDQPEYLARVLAGVSRQTRAPDEVLLADDGSGEETRRVFAEWMEGKAFRCQHFWQKHDGFRKARVLNEAIASARGEYIVFLDGDTIPHGRFFADQLELAAPGQFVQGHRALVGQRAAAEFGRNGRAPGRLRALCAGQLSGAENVFRWPLAMKRWRTDLRGVRGCNFAMWRTDLLRVNGYNEAFTGWGREDAELVAFCLMNAGVRRMRRAGTRLTCYHLWHPPADRGGLAANDRVARSRGGGIAAALRTGPGHAPAIPTRVNAPTSTTGQPPLRVVQINSMLKGGGTDDQCVMLAAALRQFGEQVWVAGPDGRNFSKVIRKLGVPLSCHAAGRAVEAALHPERGKVDTPRANPDCSRPPRAGHLADNSVGAIVRGAAKDRADAASGEEVPGHGSAGGSCWANATRSWQCRNLWRRYCAKAFMSRSRRNRNGGRDRQ